MSSNKINMSNMSDFDSINKQERVVQMRPNLILPYFMTCFNPLLVLDTLSLTIDWINQYECLYDTVITKICLKYSFKFIFDKICLKDFPKFSYDGQTFESKKREHFYMILTLSNIQNCAIFFHFYNQPSHSNDWTFAYASKNGDLGILRLCHNNGYHLDFCSVDLSKLAINNGHLHILKYLQENGCRWNLSPRYIGSLDGHSRWHSPGCMFAAKAGHLDILKYLHENGYTWDWRACYEAASNGHIEVLKYLHNNGCPWDWRACYEAASNGHIEV